MLDEHGGTMGCKACEGRSGPRDTVCRKRFEKLYGFSMPTEPPVAPAARVAEEPAAGGAEATPT
eukprot:1633326-Prorocentrum_lima.AAC.1